uniref:Uncharacterized protein n=1 Tax=Ulva partita TaxID=1605170 RepID=A0A1C9ZWE1_9CHLO|nr:hypothetical protein [Ulva partita]
MRPVCKSCHALRYRFVGAQPSCCSAFVMVPMHTTDGAFVLMSGPANNGCRWTRNIQYVTLISYYSEVEQA